MEILTMSVIAIFGFLLTYTIVKNSEKNKRYLVDMNYEIGQEKFKEHLGSQILYHIKQLEKQAIIINDQYIDQWFLKVNLTHINLKNFQFDAKNINIDFEHQNNTILIMLPIQQFDLIVHLELWNIFTNQSKQLNFIFRTKDIQIENRYKFNGVQMEFVDDWFPKFKFGSFELLDGDEEILKFQKTKKIIDWLLYKFHQTIENNIVQKLMKSLKFIQLNQKFGDIGQYRKIQNIRLLDSKKLLITIQQYNDEILQIEEILKKE